MNLSRKRQGYVIAIGVSIVVLIVRVVMREPLGEQAMMLPFVLAVIVAAWRGGLGPGLLATALGVVLRAFFLEPPLWPWSGEHHEHALNLLIFVPIGGTISFLCEALHTARRREVEKASMLRSILDAAPDAIITIDQRGTVISVNRATERLFGYADKEILGRNIAMLMPAPYRDEHGGYIARYLESREPHIIGIGREVVAQLKNGSTLPADLAVSEVVPLGLFTGIIRDISDRKELEKEVLEIAAEEDRRIGQELHDNMQQQLTGLGLLAQSLAENLAQKSTPEAAVAARIARGINEAAQHVHRLSRGLVPVDVDAEGLQASLAELASTISEQYAVNCRFHGEGAVEVADNFAATHLYRIAQEAVNNAVKHSRAKRIEISLTGSDSRVELSVRDSGVGMKENRGYNPGLGLRIMHYRANLIGAVFQIRPGQAGGTVVLCTISKQGESDDGRWHGARRKANGEHPDR